MTYDVIVVGGGAAGFFSAINLAKLNPDLSILILERGAQVLEKVRISGGGRCNVTHAVFDPKDLVAHYPRGKKELLGPFHHFKTSDTFSWFEDLGVPLKTESDGRVFPQSDSSQTIIDCFLRECTLNGVEIQTKKPVVSLNNEDGIWSILTKSELFKAKKVILATGSNSKILSVLERKGHSIVPAVPSLFTFNIDDYRIADLAGLSTQARLKFFELSGRPIKVRNPQIDKVGITGPVLITHWGLSGPGILKLSAWGARILHKLKYEFLIEVNWLPNLGEEELTFALREAKLKLARQQISNGSPFDLPKRLWKNLVEASGFPADLRWANLQAVQIQKLINELQSARFHVNGKSTFKEEFVTAGGVDLKEIDFRTYASKKLPGLYLVGEILDVDAVTGGFNFQNAWTGGFIAAQHIADEL